MILFSNKSQAAAEQKEARNVAPSVYPPFAQFISYIHMEKNVIKPPPILFPFPSLYCLFFKQTFFFAKAIEEK